MPIAVREQRSAAAPLRPARLGPADYEIERRPDGITHLRCPRPLPPHADKITERLEYWARTVPDRVFMAQRRPGGGAWRELTYAAALAQARSVGAALLARGLSPERPVAILSGNDLEHAVLALAAQYVGVPYSPVSAAYSLVSADFGKLRAIMENLTPGLVFAADGRAFARAIDATVPPDTEVVVTRNEAPMRPATAFADLVATAPTAAVDAAHARVARDTIAKILFTSGSTGTPKGVVNTQGMMCANQAMIREGLAFLQDEPPVLLDWLPWSHTFGSNHNVNCVIYNGGSFYIDDGKPLPGLIDVTVKNLRDIAPNIYFNVPKGYEALLPHLHADADLRTNLFSRCKVLFYAGAGLSQHVWDEYAALSAATSGERIIMISSIGSTETAPLALNCSWDFDRPGNIGLPAPGVELKLVPKDGKLEARLRGPNVFPGYWRRDDLTVDAFDEDGFYKIGDALKFADPNDPGKGLLFDGRIAEDFKLSSGSWVSVGPLRAAFIDHFAPLVRDAVFAGIDRDAIGVLIFPDAEACRRLCPDLPNAALPALLADARIVAEFRRRLVSFAASSSGSSNRVCRAVLLVDPPSMDAGEMTDKGSINQRAVLARRASLVEELYAEPPSPGVITLG